MLINIKADMLARAVPFRVWALGFGLYALRFRVQGLALEVPLQSVRLRAHGTCEEARLILWVHDLVL